MNEDCRAHRARCTWAGGGGGALMPITGNSHMKLTRTVSAKPISDRHHRHSWPRRSNQQPAQPDAVGSYLLFLICRVVSGAAVPRRPAVHFANNVRSVLRRIGLQAQSDDDPL